MNIEAGVKDVYHIKSPKSDSKRSTTTSIPLPVTLTTGCGARNGLFWYLREKIRRLVEEYETSQGENQEKDSHPTQPSIIS